MSNKRYNSAYYKRVRLEVLQRDYYTCHYCAMEANTVDHLIPISKGGTDDASNMVAACNSCNSGKRDRLNVPQNALKSAPRSAPRSALNDASRGRFFESDFRPTTPIGKIFPENGSARHYTE